jgi:uncharacterized protein
MSTVRKLKESGLISPPSFVPHNIHYETIMGSVAYGVSADTSDMDIYGFCVPPKDMIFPHLAGEILGFGRQINRFEQYQQHHILDKSALAGAGRTYDITIYSIVKYFQLCMENNPNMIDSLFTPANCVLHITKLGNMVRENRRIFLHKGAWHKFKGYAYSQLHKMTTKDPIGQRKKIIETYGYDVKFAYHVVRLLNEVEQILIEGDIDLQRNREQLKSIRRGEWKESDIREYFAAKEKDLEKLYLESTLPYSPDEAKIKKLLLECLEEHYGNLSDAIITPDKATEALREIQNILEKVKELL